MKRLVSTLNLSKEDWLRYRKCGITGTDAGAILGVNPYRSAFQVYEVDNRDKNADLTSLRGLLDKRQELSSQIEQLEQEKTAIEQQVKLEMQDAAYGTAPGYKVSWVSSESKRVDSQRLRKEQPDIFNQYSKNVSSRRFTIVHAA